MGFDLNSNLRLDHSSNLTPPPPYSSDFFVHSPTGGNTQTGRRVARRFSPTPLHISIDQVADRFARPQNIHRRGHYTGSATLFTRLPLCSHMCMGQIALPPLWHPVITPKPVALIITQPNYLRSSLCKSIASKHPTVSSCMQKAVLHLDVDWGRRCDIFVSHGQRKRVLEEPAVARRAAKKHGGYQQGKGQNYLITGTS